MWLLLLKLAAGVPVVAVVLCKVALVVVFGAMDAVAAVVALVLAVAVVVVSLVLALVVAAAMDGGG